MGVDLELRGRYSGTGLLKQRTDPRRFLRRLQRWIARREGDNVLYSEVGPDPEGVMALRVQLHPAAQNLVLTSPSRGELFAAVRTNVVGAGYHKSLCEMLHAMESE